MSNKKGQLTFIVLLVIIGAIALISFKGGQDITQTTSMGERQAGTLKAYYELEGARNYVEQAAKYSAFIALDDLKPAGCFSALDKDAFASRLRANLRRFTAVNLSSGTYTITIPDYDISSEVSADKINIIGVGKNINIASAGGREKLGVTRTSGLSADGLDCTDAGGFSICAGENQLCIGKVANGKRVLSQCITIYNVPPFEVSGGANILVSVTCSDYVSYTKAASGA